MKIDLVVPYVDCNDENWIKLARENGIFKPDQMRFRGQGDFFKYFFRCIEENISWVNNIYLLVQSMSQVPIWLDKRKIKVVLHKDFVPSQFLPLYNSCTFEMFLQNIPDLEEHFLYFNDDMFVMNKLEPKHFFEDNKVCQSFEYYFPNDLYGGFVKNGYKLIYNDDNKLIPVHTVKPLLKSKMKECYEIYKNDIFNSITKLRNIKNYNVYIFNYYFKKNNLCKDSIVSFSQLSVMSLYTYIKDTDIVCINDDIKHFNIYKDEKLNKYFSEKFRKKSKYEL